jgi:site-specific DNA-adenine methylase
VSRTARRLAPPYLDSVRRRRQADRLLEYVPAAAGGYVEPILDGGAVAVALLARHPEWSFVLGSPNRDLVTVWATVRAEARALVERVAFHAARHSPAYFLAERELALQAGDRADATHRSEVTGVPDEPIGSDVERAARFIYLRGTSAPGPGGLPLQHFDDAVPGRDEPAFDAAGLLELASILRDRDVEFLVGSPFSFLPAVREDDVVFLDPPTGASVEARELRSFTGAVTAKGGALLLPGSSAGSPEGVAAWRDLRRLDEPAGRSAESDLGVWGNTPLRRLLLVDDDRLRRRD